MGNKKKFHRAALERAIGELVAVGADGERVTAEHVRACARVSGYSARHLRRTLTAVIAAADKAENDVPVEACDAAKPELSAGDIATAVFLTCGRVSGAYRLLERKGFALPSLRTFRRRVLETMGTDQLVYARRGSGRYRDATVYLKNEYPHRMHSVLLDHTECPIWVVPRGFKHAVKPWATVVMDAATRYVLAWVVTFGRPSVAEVRAVLVQGMTTRYAPDGQTVVGGRPFTAVWDRGLEFLSGAITESCARLGVMPHALPAYSPHLKGRLERFWGFLKTDLLAPLPGYAEGPRDLRGNSALETAALGEDEFLPLLADWMDHYTCSHVNSSIGMTALQAWQADGTALDPIADEQLWQDFLVSKDRCKVSKNGIRWDRIDWVAPELIGTVGEHVEVRYLPHDRTFVEVFYDGAHLCTAYPNTNLSDDDKETFVQRRKSARRQARARFSAANRLRKETGENVHKLVKGKDGQRNVVERPDDLLSGGDDALRRLFGEDGEDGADANGRLF
jgi:putative transposase